MSEMAMSDSPGAEVEVEVAAKFLEIPPAQVLELVELGALESRIDRGRELIRIEDLRALAAEQARRRPFMEEIGRIGSEQMENEYRQGLI